MCCKFTSYKNLQNVGFFLIFIINFCYFKVYQNIYINFSMTSKFFRILLINPIIFALLLISCGKPGDARKIPPNYKDRVRQNIEEGRGFRLMGGEKRNIGDFDFASSNELWRASLDTLEFMPFALANYSGGILVTDWYNDGSSENESVKISVRFLSNEVRSDALMIKVFYKSCSIQDTCQIKDRSGELSAELTKKILTKAAIYEKENRLKNAPKNYVNEKLRTDQ